MLQLRVFGRQSVLTGIGQALDATGEVRALALTPAVRADHALLTGVVRHDSADLVLQFLTEHGIGESDIALAQFDEVGPSRPGRATASLIWADMLGQARSNARPIARYFVFMVVAGIIAGYGVITVNQTLIVGAMAVSPDTLPVTAACVAIVGRRGRLLVRAVATLIVGLASTGLAALLITVLLDAMNRLPADFVVGSAALSGLVTIGTGTIGVALASGVAAVLALETRASSAVGVAISVTTIPAAAYLGVAGAMGQMDKVWGAAAVLGVNVAMLLVGGTATLLVQRWLRRRGRLSARPDQARPDHVGPGSARPDDAGPDPARPSGAPA